MTTQDGTGGGRNLTGAEAPVPSTADGRGKRSVRAYVLIVFLLICAAITCALGIWQVERRTWKLDLIARVDARIHAPPVAAPGPADWPAITAASYEYRRVEARGHFLNDKEVLVQAVTDLGGGFWVLVPFRTDAGFTLFVNRGFVPPEKRDAARRAAGQVDGETTVVGLLRMTEPHGGFLRSNDPAGDRWFSRDVAEMATSRGIAPVAPYFVDADATPVTGGAPVGGLTVVRFPNSHLVYLLTWFAMCAMALGGAALVWRRSAR